jgi:uncharacterized protein with GYD domain
MKWSDTTIISLGTWTQAGLENLQNAGGSVKRLKKTLASRNVDLKKIFFAVTGNKYHTITFTKPKDFGALVECKQAFMREGNIRTETYVSLSSFEAKWNFSRPIYISLGKTTDQGAPYWGDSGKIKETIEREKKLGVDLKAFYWIVAGGAYETVAVSQAESCEALAKSKFFMASQGNIRTEILHVIEGPDFEERTG